jgi:signal peptidase I
METTTTNLETKNTETASTKKSVWEWVRFILFMLAIAFVIPNVIGLTKVSGLSMSPTFQEGNLILEEKVSKHFGEPELGDVVIINKKEAGYKIIKRVMGLPGDTVEIKAGIIFVNGEAIPEIMTSGESEDMAAVAVPDGHIFIIGDNRAPGESIDSRDPSVGPVPLTDLDGHVLVSLMPLKKIPKHITLNEE